MNRIRTEEKPVTECTKVLILLMIPDIYLQVVGVSGRSGRRVMFTTDTKRAECVTNLTHYVEENALVKPPWRPTAVQIQVNIIE